MIWRLNREFNQEIAHFKEEDHAPRQSLFLTRVYLAYNRSLSQERIFIRAFQRPRAMDCLVVRSQETL